MAVQRLHVPNRNNLKAWKKYKYLCLLILIPVVTVFIFQYLPMLGVLIAFKDYKIKLGFWGIFTSPTIGFENFRRVLTSDSFYRALGNTLIISIYKLAFTFPLPIIFALLLNELKNAYFKRLIQTVSYLPYFLSGTIVYGIVTAMLSPTYGMVNMLIMKLGGEAHYFLADPEWFRAILVLWDVWTQTGWTAIIYLAAITTINGEIYEAAIIDGASRFRQAWHVTLPGITSIIVLLLVLKVSYILDAGFEQVFLMYTPPVYAVADIIDTYVLRHGFGSASGYSFAAAVGLFKSVVTVLLVISANKIARRFGVVAIYE